LEQVGFVCDVEPSAYAELARAETADKLVLQNARGKARAIARRHDGQHRVVLGADTIVVVDNETLGKPRDDRHAAAMLRKLSGRAHVVLTAYAVVACANGQEVSEVTKTTVWFRPLPEAEIHAYVATSEPKGKAGAYAIQERGAILVEHIRGDYFSIVGLPLSRVAHTLRSFGIEPIRSPPGVPASA